MPACSIGKHMVLARFISPKVLTERQTRQTPRLASACQSATRSSAFFFLYHTVITSMPPRVRLTRTTAELVLLYGRELRRPDFWRIEGQPLVQTRANLKATSYPNPNVKNTSVSASPPWTAPTFHTVYQRMWLTGSGQ